MNLYAGKSVPLSTIKTDLEVLRLHHRFLLDDDDETKAHMDSGWALRMVRAYHDHLYKEYALADLSRVHEQGSPIGLRWRTEKEVISGRGQFTCGSMTCNREDSTLTSWELPFGYVEQGVKKLALVKLRLCEDCSALLPDSKKNRSREP